MKRTKSGKLYDTKEIFRSGFGAANIIRWQIHSVQKLSNEDAQEVIEDRYPHAGYGTSKFRQSNYIGGNYVVEVESNASCE